MFAVLCDLVDRADDAEQSVLRGLERFTWRTPPEALTFDSAACDELRTLAGRGVDRADVSTEPSRCETFALTADVLGD